MVNKHRYNFKITLKNAEKYDHNIFDHIVITEIYANCFFDRTVIPKPYTIKLNGELSDDCRSPVPTKTHPTYSAGWDVTAAPGDTLTDVNGQTYNYLYWEGETNAQWDMSEVFCMKGGDTPVLFEKALVKLGLNRKYWLPLMEQNPYNIMSFRTDAYTKAGTECSQTYRFRRCRVGRYRNQIILRQKMRVGIG